MVMIGRNINQTLAGRKSTSDFTREAEEFEARKKQRAMQEQLMPLQVEQAQLGMDKTRLDMEKARQEMSQPKAAFEGSSWDAQIANEAYAYNLNKGMDPKTAKQSAIDMVMGTKTTSQLVKDPVTGNQSIIEKPRRPLFQTGGFNPEAPMPQEAPEGDPMAESQAAIQARQEDIGANKYQSEGAPMPVQEPSPQQGQLPTTAWEAAKLGTGPMSTAMSGLTYGAGLLGQDFAENEPYIESRQVLTLAEQELTNALRQNPRFSEGERKAIENQISGALNPRIWRAPNVALREMRLLNQQLENRMQRAIKDSQDESQTVEYRKSQADAAAAMSRFLDTLGVPQGGEEVGEASDVDSLINMYAD